jgi:DNA-binding NarL/FixJ family response regulator
LFIHAVKVSSVNAHLEYEKLVNILEDENINITEHLVSRLQQEFGVNEVNAREIDMAVATRDVELSKREKEVLWLSCQGLSIKSIAEKLFISDRTVESHRASLMEKTGAKNIIEVIIYALKHELIEI